MRKRARITAATLVTLGCALCGVAFGQGLIIPQYRDAISRPKPTASCPECGTVRSIREITARRDPKVHGTGSATAFDSRVVGAVIVLPFDSNRGAHVGGVGTDEMNDRMGLSSYELTIVMDDGAQRIIERRDGGRYGIGDRVRLSEGRLELISDAR